MTSPDYQIVTFDLFGVRYLYEGGSARLEVIDGLDTTSVRPMIEAQLRGMPLHHVPASDQIKQALASLGFRPDEIPPIEYAEDQPSDQLPAGAVS